MKLQNETELRNTQRKLSALEDLIGEKEKAAGASAIREFALQSMRSMARDLRAEADEYERTHQMT